MIPARTQGKNAIACILVLWPTWMICMLYEQKAIAIAPAMATIFFVPILNIRRKAPTSVIKKNEAGLFPLISVL